MGKTAALRKVIKTQLDKLTGETYYRQAPDDAAYPYKVFDLSRIALGDLSRDDLDLVVDVWDLAPDPKTVDQIADDIEDLLNAENLPQETVLPTFFRDSRYPVPDPDKAIQHEQLHFIVQNYTNNQGGHSNG